MSKAKKSDPQAAAPLPYRADSNEIIRPINIKDIYVGERLRALRPEKVVELADSMSRQGQLVPIIVREPNHHTDTIEAKYVLLAGLHRLKAGASLGWALVQAKVLDYGDCANTDAAALIEIDENLVRSELTDAEEELHLKRRKEIYEKLHPETVHGAVGRGGKSARSEHSFVEDTAKKTGQGASTIRKKITRAKRTDNQALADARGTSLDKPGELEALSKKSKAEQRRLAKEAKAGKKVSAKPTKGEAAPVTGSVERPIEEVKEASAALTGESITPEPNPMQLLRAAANREAPTTGNGNEPDDERSLAKKLFDAFNEAFLLCLDQNNWLHLSNDKKDKDEFRSAMKRLQNLREVLPRLARPRPVVN